MPFWHLYGFARYIPELKTLSTRLEALYITYIEGTPQNEWCADFTFRKINLPYRFIRSKTLRFFLSRRRFFSQIRDVDVDLIYSMGGTWEQESARYLARKMGVPYVVRLRGDLMEVRKAFKVNFVKAKLLDYLDVRSLRDADLVIPISEALAEKIKSWGVDERKVSQSVPIGVDTEMFRPMKVQRSSDFTVAYAGRLSLEKGVFRLQELIKKLSHIHFIVAGPKETDIPFPSNVSYYGWLPHHEMPVFYNKADLVILPSFTEGFPNVILEAYACEKPVLATPEAFPRELKIFGAVANFKDFETVIEQLKHSNLKPLGREARLYVEKNFKWENFGENIFKFLKVVLRV